MKKNTEFKNRHSDNLRCRRVFESVPMMVVLGLFIGIQASLFVQRLSWLYLAFRPVGSMRSSVMAMCVFWMVLEEIKIRQPEERHQPCDFPIFLSFDVPQRKAMSSTINIENTLRRHKAKA